MSTRAGQPAEPQDLVDIDALIAAYYDRKPDPDVPAQRVAFGTSGHRGSSLATTFNEDHILATTQAIVDYRRAQGIAGPVYLGRDTHALSLPAERTALEVLVANEIDVRADARDAWVPTPALSHAILRHNRDLAADDPARADGIIVTPSHNPPADGGFKYNPPHGGPADTDATGWIADRANELIAAGLEGVSRVRYGDIVDGAVGSYDFRDVYVRDLGDVIDMDAIARAGVRIGADPLGGASVEYWQLIAEVYGLELTVVNPDVDPTWKFMTLDWDEKIRMDPSSPSAMASLVARRAEFDVLTGNDADADRHGIVTPDAGLMNPNHFLAVAIDYLFAHRPGWPASAAVGKTLVSSMIIDRVTAELGRTLLEVPVGFKWFVPGLIDGSVAFGGEESAGASFLRHDGGVWTTDKDGIILCLLAAEIIAATGKTPSARYAELEAEYGASSYERVDAPASDAEKAALKALSPEDVAAETLAGDPITAKLSEAPGNGAAIGGLKVQTEFAWFAARPSGTEAVYKLYAESLKGPQHLAEVQAEAREIVAAVLGA
ncbi:phosphoglucomutase (alpha-D-glucose-1,6-bisphosphate-dependent) [Microbacterium excoecariae]|uniref:phosphoglucomutase (alpha-D-glucose-1,6-bisphosphate-dependent) n=1 Tax=Microbacterium excoecariae TaxID=2715210 RepID=UPI001407A23C|nr:phosphoglucomutase (alpha-D-glucose-1,6-bisphosphate-dependent) [Microbacterium excoecariae]NHI15680.1 alpha-D-glucose phosphate-specific phosphoglucomutase [Microbacterium excoecariae]